MLATRCWQRTVKHAFGQGDREVCNPGGFDEAQAQLVPGRLPARRRRGVALLGRTDQLRPHACRGSHAGGTLRQLADRVRSIQQRREAPQVRADVRTAGRLRFLRCAGHARLQHREPGADALRHGDASLVLDERHPLPGLPPGAVEAGLRCRHAADGAAHRIAERHRPERTRRRRGASVSATPASERSAARRTAPRALVERSGRQGVRAGVRGLTPTLLDAKSASTGSRRF